MKFLVDAHFPRRLCAMLARRGHDATHTLDLPSGNTTKDRVINQLSFDEQRVVVSKDTDFSIRTCCKVGLGSCCW